MTKDEFLPTLSLKAQNIVAENLRVFHNKSFQVFYSGESSVISQKNSDYVINVKNDILEDIEYRFLHEFFHCVQHECGFPSLISSQPEYKGLASFISSLILDLDVRERLENNGYFQDLKYIKKSVDVSIKLLKIIQETEDEKELTTVADIMGMAGILLTSDVAYIDNRELLVLTKNVRPKILKYYDMFSRVISTYSYTDGNGVKSIFEYLISELELSAIIEIRPHYTS